MERVVSKQVEIVVEEHLVSEGGSERVSLDVEVAKNFIGSPSTKEVNDISVNLCTEQGHGTARTEG